MSKSLAVRVEGLNLIKDGERILQDIHLEVNRGDILAIIGPNGGGKTTLLRAILGLEEIESGKIEILGQAPQESYPDIGYVAQNSDFNLDFPIRAVDVVGIGCFGKKDRTAILNAMKLLGVKSLADKRIAELSGGQRQRVMIASALCSKPTILFLDEPTSHIDPAGQSEIYKLLSHLNKEKGVTIVTITHDISLMMNYATKVAYVNRSLTLHDISDKKAIFHTHENEDAHFCEVELLQLLGGEHCDICKGDSHG